MIKKSMLMVVVTISAATILLSGCGESFHNEISKMGAGISGGNYKVTVWSGGQPVKVYEVSGYINSETHSDGWYFFVNGKLVRVSGTVTIEQL